MQFLCDQMFSKLGKWLRAAGYDTAIISVAKSDRLILEQARQEQRFLLTRDRHFLKEFADPHVVVWLKSNSLNDAVQELSERLTINWLKAPFSRCLVCNHELILITKEQIIAPFESAILERFDQFWYCAHCQKYYWLGSHTKNMLETLKRWQNTLR